MIISLNRDALMKAGDTAAKRKELGKQVAFIFGMADTAKEMMGAKHLGNVKLVGKGLNVGNFTTDAIKSFLAKKYAVATDTPALSNYTNRFAEFIHQNMPELDMGYEALFDHVNMVGTGQDNFEIKVANMQAAWNQRKPGEKTKIRTEVQDGSLTVKMAEFSDGFQLLDQWLEYNQFYKIEEAMAEFINSYYEAKAKFHYGVFTSLSGVDFTVTPYADDVQAMNAASAAIHRKMRGKGLPGGDNTGLTILVAPEKVGKVEKMLTATRGSAIIDNGTIKEPLTARINQVVSSTFVPADADGYYLIRRGGRIKKADWKNLTLENGRDIEVSGSKVVGVGQYNCAIGDTDQVLFVPFK